MKCFNIFVVLIYVLCAVGCQSQKSDMEKTSMTIAWDHLSQGNFNLEDVEYVSLETTDSSLLGGISKVLYKNNRFYVLDKMSGGVYIFNRKGKFLSSIVKSGEGPDEYIELMDMDVDAEGHVYLADNAGMKIQKYRSPEWKHDETFDVGRHFFEFCCLDDDCFLLKDVFGDEEMKLAHFDGKTRNLTPLVDKAFASVNEREVMKCSKFNLYRSGEHLYYYERFTPNVYSVSNKGELSKNYTIVSANYIPESDLAGLQNDPMKFLRERKYIKDIVSLYENKDYFVCMPFVTPVATYLLVPKNVALQAQKINLMDKRELVGCGLIEGVADNKFLVVLNPSIEGVSLPEELSYLNEDSNPVLLLFSIGMDSDNN